jgi:twitching motility protein PilU
LRAEKAKAGGRQTMTEIGNAGNVAAAASAVNGSAQDQQAKVRAYVGGLLGQLVKLRGSDLILTVDFPPAIKLDGNVVPLSDKKLDAALVRMMALSIMNERNRTEFAQKKECNFAIVDPVSGRFRVNVLTQKGHAGLVMRRITTEIPTFDELGLPDTLRKVSMSKRGLVLFVGATGSGKSTSLAAMVGHRNQNSAGHIITIEDPVEFVHEHGKSIITQREVGVDTENWEIALENTLRQAPDVILIGEIRNEETMDYALKFAETGHLCMATLHANSANQALDRILNFFPHQKRNQALMDLSLNLRAMVSQRLIPKESGSGRVAAVEILLNTPHVSDLIFKGDIPGLKKAMEEAEEEGMRTFDRALFELYEAGHIGHKDALKNADSENEVRLNIKLRSERAKRENTFSLDAFAGVSLVEERAKDDGKTKGGGGMLR